MALYYYALAEEVFLQQDFLPSAFASFLQQSFFSHFLPSQAIMAPVVSRTAMERRNSFFILFLV